MALGYRNNYMLLNLKNEHVRVVYRDYIPIFSLQTVILLPEKFLAIAVDVLVCMLPVLHRGQLFLSQYTLLHSGTISYVCIQ